MNQQGEGNHLSMASPPGLQSQQNPEAQAGRARRQLADHTPAFRKPLGPGPVEPRLACTREPPLRFILQVSARLFLMTDPASHFPFLRASSRYPDLQLHGLVYTVSAPYLNGIWKSIALATGSIHPALFRRLRGSLSEL